MLEHELGKLNDAIVDSIIFKVVYESFILIEDQYI